MIKIYVEHKKGPQAVLRVNIFIPSALLVLISNITA